MPKEEWGVKRVCPTCSTRFFDLRNNPMTCPSCGASFTIESLTAVKPKALRPEKVKPEPEDAEELVQAAPDDAIEDDDDIEDEILEDDDDNVDLEEIADVAADDEED